MIKANAISNVVLEKKTLSPKEVEAKYGFGVSKLSHDRIAGVGIPYSKLGSSVKYHVDDIEAFIKLHRVDVK